MFLRCNALGLRALALGLFLSLSACGGGGGGSSPPPAPAQITAQPKGATVTDGQAATLSVTTDITSGVSYQWQLNGAAIPGATAASYTTPALVYSPTSYQYTVVVSNGGGSVTSQAASISVTPVAPTIDGQPASASFADGSDASFGVHATGSKPFAYQWMRDGTPIPGATDSSFTLPSAALSDSGTVFTVEISNVAGKFVSQAASLIVTPVPAQITAAPMAQTVVDGATATFSVVAKGSASLGYQWSLNGHAIAGATSASYSLSAVYANTGQQFSVTVTNAYGTGTSAPVPLTVTPLAPSVATAPQSYTANTGDSVTFTERAVGTVPLSYQWQKSQDNGLTWTDIGGATSATYSIPSLTLAHAYTQVRVAVTNVAGTVSSASAALTVNPNVHIVVGTAGGEGYADGKGANARFNSPKGIVSDGSGNLLVADSMNGVIRKVAPDGTVTTVAGKPGVYGYANGSATAARFTFLGPLAQDSAGNVYIGDIWNIRKMTPDGVVSPLAGAVNDVGSDDGSGTAARFSSIVGIAVNSAGNIVVLDGGLNQTVRMVTPNGVVTTLAGKAGQFGYVNGPGATASFTSLMNLTLDDHDNIYVGDSNAIRRVTPAGDVSPWAGAPDTAGGVDGTFAAALFNIPRSLAFDGAGNLYAGEQTDFRRLGTDGQVAIIAGSQWGLDVDGTGGAAVLTVPAGITPLPSGGGFAFTEFGGSVRTVSATGKVSTLAGINGYNGPNLDGPASSALFAQTGALTGDAAGNLYMVSQYTLRKVDPQGNVTTIAVPNAWFECVYNAFLAVDGAGNLYVSAPQCNQIFKITPAGSMSVVAGQFKVSGSADGPGSQASFNWPLGIAADATGNIFVVDSNNFTIRKIDAQGNVTTIAGQVGASGPNDGRGTSARFFVPNGMTIDGQGNLYVMDAGSTVRKISSDGTVTTIGGYYLVNGVSNGAQTRFNHPTSIAADAEGNLYVADTGSSVIQKLMPSGWAYPVMGQVGVKALLPGVGGAINQPLGVAVLPNGRLVVTSELAIVGD